jgi:hypothetical protein
LAIDSYFVKLGEGDGWYFYLKDMKCSGEKFIG